MFVSDKLAGMDLGFRYGCPSQNKTAHLWFVLFSWMWTACLLSGGLITLTGWWFKLQEAFPNYLFLIKLDAMGTCSFSTSCECSWEWEGTMIPVCYLNTLSTWFKQASKRSDRQELSQNIETCIVKRNTGFNIVIIFFFNYVLVPDRTAFMGAWKPYWFNLLLASVHVWWGSNASGMAFQLMLVEPIFLIDLGLVLGRSVLSMKPAASPFNRECRGLKMTVKAGFNMESESWTWPMGDSILSSLEKIVFSSSGC